MPQYKIENDTVLFRQSKLPRMFFVLLGANHLDIYIHFTNRWDYPYMVRMSESDFLGCIELAKEL